MGKHVYGYCGVTGAAERVADCAVASHGTWKLNRSASRSSHAALGACRELCLGCERCHYISFSATFRDCSWFTSCDLSLIHI